MDEFEKKLEEWRAKGEPYLILYKDEMQLDAWRDYCAILGAPQDADKLAVRICRDGISAKEEDND